MNPIQRDLVSERRIGENGRPTARRRAVPNLIRKIKRRIHRWRHGVPPQRRATDDPSFMDRKQAKLQRIESILRHDLPCRREPLFHDFLTDDLRAEFRIVETENVSSHPYDGDALAIIESLPDGLILDCGAGLRGDYLDNVVNFEICDYPTTDVRGVGEQLPFRSESFDAVFSFSVLEHVRRPFDCAREISRVLKPGGRLYSVVPFLQPFHAYPHHYYNMTAQGLANLFADEIVVDRQEVNTGGMPIFMLTWVLRRWAESLPPRARRQFLRSSVGSLTGDPMLYLDRPYVTELSEAARFELAATTSLFGRKKSRDGN
jgi:SAM-dependent methyltransferase